MVEMLLVMMALVIGYRAAMMWFGHIGGPVVVLALLAMLAKRYYRMSAGS